MKGLLFSSRHSSPSSTPPPQSHHHHTFSDTIIDENFDYTEEIITRWDLDSHDQFTPLFADDRQEAKRYLQAVTSLQNAMHYFVKLSSSSSSSSERLIRAQKLMQIAIKRLEKEFYVILSTNRKNLDSETVSGHSSRATSTSASSSISDFYDDEISKEEECPTTPSRTPPRTPPHSMASDIAMEDLKSIADCMIASGYARECVNIYKLIRKSIIDETIYYLGVQKMNHSHMQKMDWKVLEPKIKTWLHAIKIAIKTLFLGERLLCDFVFPDKIAESCFAEISKDAAMDLFSFPLNFGKSKKILSPEKTFRALDLYEAISDLWPEIESIFSHESLSVVRSEAVAALVKLGEAVRIMLTQFEAAIKNDSSKTPSTGGVHPLTRYVMNYLVFLADYSGAVTDILADWTVTAQTPLPESYFSSPTSGAGDDPSAAAITVRLAWLILVLLCKLDGKAVMYNDVALSYLFLANNLNYVVITKVRDSSLGLLMGPDWIWKNQSKVNRYLSNYQRMGWSDVIASLPEDPTVDIPAQDAKECFRRFNSSFEEAYKKQNSWVIPDPKLRDEVKVNLANNIVPGYRVFYNKHRGGFVREIEPIVRYAPEDLGNYLSDLFFPAAGDSRTSSYMPSSQPSRGR